MAPKDPYTASGNSNDPLSTRVDRFSASGTGGEPQEGRTWGWEKDRSFVFSRLQHSVGCIQSLA